jgi:hypothetical protein
MGNYIGVSHVQDYVHRPFIYHDFNLYVWVKQSKKSRRSKVQQAEFNEKYSTDKEYDKETIDDGEDELNMLGSSPDISKLDASIAKLEDSSDYDLLEEPVEDNNEDNIDELNIGDNDAQHLYEDKQEEHQFLKSHPQFQTHQI